MLPYLIQQHSAYQSGLGSDDKAYIVKECMLSCNEIKELQL